MNPEKERLEAPPGSVGVSNGLLAAPSAAAPFLLLFGLLHSFSLLLAFLVSILGFVLFAFAFSVRKKWLSALGILILGAGIFWVTKIV